MAKVLYPVCLWCMDGDWCGACGFIYHVYHLCFWVLWGYTGVQVSGKTGVIVKKPPLQVFQGWAALLMLTKISSPCGCLSFHR